MLVAVWGLVPQRAGSVPLGKYSGVFATILARFSRFWNSIGGSQTERLRVPSPAWSKVPGPLNPREGAEGGGCHLAAFLQQHLSERLYHRVCPHWCDWLLPSLAAPQRNQICGRGMCRPVWGPY